MYDCRSCIRHGLQNSHMVDCFFLLYPSLVIQIIIIVNMYCVLLCSNRSTIWRWSDLMVTELIPSRSRRICASLSFIFNSRLSWIIWLEHFFFLVYLNKTNEQTTFQRLKFNLRLKKIPRDFFDVKWFSYYAEFSQW